MPSRFVQETIAAARHIRQPLDDAFAGRPRTPGRAARIAKHCAAALVIAAALTAGPAHAIGGTIENSWVENCNGDPEEGISVGTEFLDKPNQRVGDVFYARTYIGRMGGACGAHMAAHVEVVLPAGVSLAISPDTPVRCGNGDGDGGLTQFYEGCPQTSTPGMFGPAFDQAAPGGPSAWEIPGGPTHIMDIPLRSSRKLVGSASSLPSCNRVYGSPPCPADQAGDHLQFAIKVIDGFGAPWLAPYVPLFVQDAPVTAPTPSSPAQPAATTPAASAPKAQRIAVSAPRTIRITRLRRGVPIVVRLQQPGSRVSARLTVRGRTVAQAGSRGARSTTRTLRLRSTAGGRRTLRRLRGSTSAILHVTVTSPSGSATTSRKHVKLRR